MDCRETCRCPLGVCDRVTGRCLQHLFLQQAAARSPDRGAPGTEPDAGSGDGNAVTQDLRSQHAARSPGTKWFRAPLTPRRSEQRLSDEHRPPADTRNFA
ncbi:endothelial cell-specific molecule 1-like, partial [Myotis lucifugus]|uniref:endothelial cell-specific molecule 1-like n=1 Tax=Myotis lucifugus TaxID=59463 RepID=UPI000CCC3BED